MSSEDDYVRLVGHFRRLGYHVSRRVVGGSDTIVVAAKPENANGITLYQRSVHLHQSNEGQWYTSLGMVTLPWVDSIDALCGFVSRLMESEDAVYFQEQQRRARSVSANA
jgi:hypothetical protein